ncbi:AGAP007415-PA [Anopheles gambiae str. PEST]|uniref:AGAP007415-PA n=1 Tax=Anopheles gambiae TaxID=7165 RepID=A7URE0_ANOGA|nr:AGAP007415-PA [Anopheles gambiae str. PEST]
MLTEGIQVRSCSNGVPPPAIVSIAGCSEMPCDFVRGVEAGTMTMVYEAPFDIQTLRYDRIMTALGITSSLPVRPERENGCEFVIGSMCPFRQGDLIISTYTSSPLAIYPLIPVTIEFYVYDEQDRMVTCFQYDVRIVLSTV